MADKKRPPLPKFNTPVGVARYPHLNQPDTRFDDDGVYHVDLLLPADNAKVQELITYLEGIRDEHFKAEKKQAKKDGKRKKFVKAPIALPDLDDAGDETGNLILKTKLKAIARHNGEEWKKEPRLFDDSKPPQPVSKTVAIWSGSKLIVAGKVIVYAMTSKVLVEKDGKQTEKKITSVGVSLKCEAVQIMELVTGTGATAEDYGLTGSGEGYQTEASKLGLGEGSADDEEGEEDEEDF